MQHDELLKEFELEIWQYLDKSLPNHRLKYWENKINSDVKLQQLIEDAEETFAIYNEYDDVDIDDTKFNKFIETATSQESFYGKVKKIVTPGKENYIPKLAFGSILIISSIVFLLLSKSPNPIKSINASIFSWNDENMEAKFTNINSKISILENEEIGEYYLYLRTKDEWNREIISIDKRINSLFSETNNYEL